MVLIDKVDCYSEKEYQYLSDIVEGLISAHEGDFEEALQYYERADLSGLGIVSPETQLLRHKAGKAKGVVKAIPPTEDRVIAIQLKDDDYQPLPGDKLKSPIIDQDIFVKNIRRYLWYFKKHHALNLTNHLPHTMVLSTGRCGTVSLSKLFEKTDYLTHHSYMISVSGSDRIRMMCKLMDEDLPKDLLDALADNWITTRAAEWLGAMEEGKKMMGLNHMDTIYAPIFLLLHPKSRFIYLHRDPVKIFESFYSKDQWNTNQLRPVDYTFENGFRYKEKDLSLPEKLAWYIKFTEEFSRCIQKLAGDRWIEISADKLFAGDKEEIEKLMTFTDALEYLDLAKKHFKTIHNEKSHKVIRDSSEGLEKFKESYYAL